MVNPYKHFKEHEGEVFKYRNLCDLLGLDFKSGKAKELQLKKLRQFLDLDQNTIPRKIILKEIYDDDKQKIVGGKGKYLPFIKNILLDQLHTENPYIGTYAELFLLLGIASERYVKARYEMYPLNIKIKQKFTDVIDMDFVVEENLSHFLSMTGTVLKEIVRSSLNQMKDKNLITIEHSLRLFRHATIDSNGKKKSIIEHHDLSPVEHSMFVKIGTDLIEKFRLSGFQDLFYRAPKAQTLVNVQEQYKSCLTDFIKSLGYEFSATLFIITSTEEGQNYEIQLPYLNKSILKENISKKFNQDIDLKKIIPQPMLDKFMALYF